MSEVQPVVRSSQVRADVGCLLVGGYVDEAEVPESLAYLRNHASSNSVIEHPRVVASYLDRWSTDDPEKELTVLLSDQRVGTVRGHSLRFVANAANPSDYGSYGIVRRTGDNEALVALFRVVEVKGVFSGDMPGP
jgi:hypothetical protein